MLSAASVSFSAGSSALAQPSSSGQAIRRRSSLTRPAGLVASSTRALARPPCRQAARMAASLPAGGDSVPGAMVPSAWHGEGPRGGLDRVRGSQGASWVGSRVRAASGRPLLARWHLTETAGASGLGICHVMSTATSESCRAIGVCSCIHLIVHGPPTTPRSALPSLAPYVGRFTALLLCDSDSTAAIRAWPPVPGVVVSSRDLKPWLETHSPLLVLPVLSLFFFSLSLSLFFPFLFLSPVNRPLPNPGLT